MFVMWGVLFERFKSVSTDIDHFPPGTGTHAIYTIDSNDPTECPPA